jgi:apolipoprotein N-acyltransferase
MLAGIALSGVLSAIYVHGGHAWVLGLVMLVPWLCTMDTRPTLPGALMSAWLMSVAFTAAAFWWFGLAIGDYTRVGGSIGLAVLLLLAPVFQPQFLAFSLVRHLAGKRHGPAVRALAAAAAWVGAEWALPKVLGDTLGYGLYPSAVMRQFADLGGSAGLTVLLLLANEGFALAWARRAGGWRKVSKPMIYAALVPGVIAAYGFFALALHPAPSGETLRVGMVQSNLVDYEQRRRESGAQAVVREVLDTHFAMTYDAVERQRADAVLWSETVYPTTFGNPKSEAGAEFDAAIQTIVNAAKVPFVFGTYERDARGEYNAAAFVLPESGLLGFYRKTRLFPLTEYVPHWLDGPALRRWLPWTGSWLAGDGARVFPLRLRDGREVPVMASICLDDVDTLLAIEGARLGARAILTLSNDSWFTRYPLGARIHHTAAAFRSIETRLPQFRVTSNGTSAVIDATGAVVAGSNMGERTLVVGQLPVPQPPRTLMVMWGDWVGPLGVGFLVFLTLLAASPRWLTRHASGEAPVPTPLHTPAGIGPARLGAPARRPAARLCPVEPAGNGRRHAARRLAARQHPGPDAPVCRLFPVAGSRGRVCAAGVLGPALGGPRHAGPATRQAAAGHCAEGHRRRDALAAAHAGHRIDTAPDAGTERPPTTWPLPTRSHWPARWRPQAPHPCGGSPVARGALCPSGGVRAARAVRQPLGEVSAVPASAGPAGFHLHQNIAYGGWFGEFYTFGLKAYGLTFALWWASWTMGVVLCAAALRAVVEAATLLTLAVHPPQTAAVRATLERMALAVLYLGLPGWLLLHASW